MPTPNTYDKLALNFSPHKRTVLGIAGLGFVAFLMSILAASQFQWNFFPLAGLGFITLIWSWGLFLIIKWYGADSRMASRLPKVIRSGLRWYAAFFLDIWFAVGSFAAFRVIWNSLFK